MMAIDNADFAGIDGPGTETPGKAVYRLYRQTCLYKSCPPRWAEQPSVEEENAAAEDEASLAPIVIRYRKPDPQLDWEASVVHFHDGDMREVLLEVLHNYQDLDLQVDGWTIKEPFMPLVHRWSSLEHVHETSTRRGWRSAAAGLIDAVKPLIAGPLEALVRARDEGRVLFDDAWLLYAPGTNVVTQLYGVQSICRVLKYRFEKGMVPAMDQWTVDMEFVDWDGQRCGYSKTSLSITRYTGFSKVTSLSIFPMSLDLDPEALEQRMVERGRKFERLRGYHYVLCHGSKVLLETKTKEIRPVAGKICVDAHAYYSSCNIVPPKLRGFDEDIIVEDVSREPSPPPSPPLRPRRRRGSRKPPSRRVPYDTYDRNTHGYGDEDAFLDPIRPVIPHPVPYDDSFATLPPGSNLPPASRRDITATTCPPPVTKASPPSADTAAKGPHLRQAEDLTPLTPSQLLLATPWVKGFDMKSKSWAEVRVDQVRDMVWNDDAFDKLVLPNGEKELAWSFVESKTILASSSSSSSSSSSRSTRASDSDTLLHDGEQGKEKGKTEEPSEGRHLAGEYHQEEEEETTTAAAAADEAYEPFDDFIPDKGQGLIILMFGPPGVGKTFTAEAVAERCRVPLYAVSAGQLGARAAEVRDGLDRALGLCTAWNAMLLLDEADVFLGRRTGGGGGGFGDEEEGGSSSSSSSSSLARNELVALFLTRLEYYCGVLFLATNRISSVDPAFQSRVDLFLPYYDLGAGARRKVWANFIERAGGRRRFELGDEKAMDRLAGLKLNGREIKNLIKSALLLNLRKKDSTGQVVGGGKIPLDLLYSLAEKRVQALKALEGSVRD